CYNILFIGPCIYIYEYDVWLRKISKLRYIQDKANLFKTYYISKIKQQ
ncbi:unnamed protein product, partial [Brassica rapa subsp. narinosa]